MATFFGSAASETISPTFVSAGVVRVPGGSFPGAGDDTLFGGGGNDSLDGGGGNDVLSGDDGNDFLRGNTGADVLNGGAGIDTASYTESTAGVVVSLATGLGFGGSAAGDILFSIENLNGSNFNDALTGDGSANTLNGFGGNDSLDGGAGNDSLFGGDGDDFMRGNTGADVLNGGAGIDTASYTESTAGVNVNLTTGVGVGGSAAGDTLTAIENLNGSNFGDTLTGNASANVLNGFGGNDTLLGGDGNDTLIGDIGNDRLDGGLGNDLLTGGLGTDTLIGGGGFDRFDFNSVNESLPGAVRDVITDFAGNGIFAGDLIDVSTIDANPGAAGDQAFTFIGAAAFTPVTIFTPLGATAELRYSGGVLQASTDADTAPEFEIQLAGAPALVGTDLVL